MIINFNQLDDIKTPYTMKIFLRLFQYVYLISGDVIEWCIKNNYLDYKPEHLLQLIHQINYFEQDHFAEDDAFQFLINTEEIDPRIPEDEALERMKKITDKYPNRRR